MWFSFNNLIGGYIVISDNVIDSYKYSIGPGSFSVAMWSGLSILLILVRAAVAFYLLIILSKLAFRGIKALDIYIKEKQK
jgi:hypothetical protein